MNMFKFSSGVGFEDPKLLGPSEVWRSLARSGQARTDRDERPAATNVFVRASVCGAVARARHSVVALGAVRCALAREARAPDRGRSNSLACCEWRAAGFGEQGSDTTT
jgi:hypothetical protein